MKKKTAFTIRVDLSIIIFDTSKRLVPYSFNYQTNINTMVKTTPAIVK